MVRRGMGLAVAFAIGCGGAAPAAQAPQRVFRRKFVHSVPLVVEAAA
jgi:hypothetical protein